MPIYAKIPYAGKSTRHVERRKAGPKREIAEPEHIDVDFAFRRLFPWVADAFMVAPANWGPNFAPEGREFPAEPHGLPVDVRIVLMHRDPKKHGRLREDGESFGFPDFFLAARAGLFRAVVAAAWSYERVERRRRKDGINNRLKAVADKANMLSMEVEGLRGKLSWDDFDLVGADPERPVKPEEVLRRKRQFDEVFEGIEVAASNLANLVALCDVEVYRSSPPSKKHHTWARAFAEALAHTWNDLTGDFPKASSPRFNKFVTACYKTVAFKERPEDAPAHEWAETARQAVKTLRNRQWASPFNWEALIKSGLAFPLDRERPSRDVSRRLSMTRACDPMDVRLPETLLVEDLRRIDPKFRRALEIRLNSGS